jgi:site-specific recombinase XerD
MGNELTAATQATALDDLRTLLPDFRRHLRATNKAPSTITVYTRDAEGLACFLLANGMPTAASALTREHLEHFLAHLATRPNQRTGAPLKPAYLARVYRSLQQLFRWLADEGEIHHNPFEKMTPPQVPEQPVPIITEDQLRELIKACTGTTFQARRDMAIVRLFLDTGVRSAELSGLRLDDLDFEHDVALVQGKGRRGRAVPFGAKTGEAIRRYLRARTRHAHAARTAPGCG